MSVGWKQEVFLNPQTRARQELPVQEIGENRRNMGRIATFVHHAESARKQEFEPSRQGIDIRCCNDGNTVFLQEGGLRFVEIR